MHYRLPCCEQWGDEFLQLLPVPLLKSPRAIHEAGGRPDQEFNGIRALQRYPSRTSSFPNLQNIGLAQKVVTLAGDQFLLRLAWPALKPGLLAPDPRQPVEDRKLNLFVTGSDRSASRTVPYGG